MKNSTIYRRLTQLVDLAADRTVDDYNARGKAFARQRAADRARLLEGRIKRADLHEEDREFLLFRLVADVRGAV